MLVKHCFYDVQNIQCCQPNIFILSPRVLKLAENVSGYEKKPYAVRVYFCVVKCYKSCIFLCNFSRDAGEDYAFLAIFFFVERRSYNKLDTFSQLLFLLISVANTNVGF